MAIPKGEAFTLELQVYESAGLTKGKTARMIGDLLEAMVAELGEPEDKIYLYSRDSKIRQRLVMEVTGVYRDPNPRPVVTPELRDALEFYLRQNK